MPEVRVTKRGEDRVHSGHPWVYRSDIAEARASAGETVRVIGPRGRVLGEALYSDKSEITIRMLTRGDVRADPRTVADALASRRSSSVSHCGSTRPRIAWSTARRT